MRTKLTIKKPHQIAGDFYTSVTQTQSQNCNNLGKMGRNITLTTIFNQYIISNLK